MLVPSHGGEFPDFEKHRSHDRENALCTPVASLPGGAMAHYERLSALDASFLDIEDENSHMHVAAALVFEGGPLVTSHGGLDVERIRAYIESRLHLIPRYRQRLGWTPLERHPVWVDDARFNVFYHVRHSALPRPGEIRQLKRLCGRILSQKLDLTKPLWEIWVVEGLEEGKFALVAKAHHSMVDGVSGMDLLTVLLSPTPEESFVPAPRWRPRPAPSTRELLAAEAYRRSVSVLALGRSAVRTLGDPRRALAAAWEGAVALAETLGGATPASFTPLNPAIGPHRRFDWLRVDLDTVKAIKNRLGGTVNDVVLATVVGAIRRFLLGRGVRPDALDFRALVPVSIRGADEHGPPGNRVAQMLARLPIGERSPRRRYQKVVTLTTALKRSHQVRGSELIEELSDWTATGVLTTLVRLAVRLRAYNIVVTNVPGPSMPLFLLGAPLRDAYPMVPLYANQGVGVALFSYAGGLFWGLNADWDAMPDLHDLIGALQEEFELLRGLAMRGASAA
jgi:WS/DGAT/MGAT family acyltransferase